jgi:hypothetical protein
MFQITTRLRARRGRKTRGQGLVEFALILPILMLFFVTVLDLGRVAAVQVALTNAAREGAFQAALTPTDFNGSNPCPVDGSSNKIWCRIQLESSGDAAITGSDVTVSCSPGSCTAPVSQGSLVTVRVRGHFQLFTPLMGAFFGGQNVTLSASATEHREWLPATGIAPTPTPSPTPVPTPTPVCKWVPNMLGNSVSWARTAWTNAGFTGSFSPASGSNSKTVLTQSQTPNDCLPATTSISVTHS